MLQIDDYETVQTRVEHLLFSANEIFMSQSTQKDG